MFYKSTGEPLATPDRRQCVAFRGFRGGWFVYGGRRFVYFPNGNDANCLKWAACTARRKGWIN